MDVVDYKYISILSPRLGLYKQKSINPYKANFRCPICGDSKISKTKTRGWFIENDNTIFFKCFNCGEALHLSQFIREFDESLFKEYLTDSYLEGGRTRKSNKVEEEKAPASHAILEKLMQLDKMPVNHPAVQYIKSRKIPEKYYEKLYYAKNFNEFVNGILPGKMNKDIKEPRLVIPMLSPDNKLWGFQGRSFKKEGLRYISIMLGDYPKVFGAESVNWKRRYIVTEGPIDSMFIENAISMAGADINLSYLNDIENAIFVFDNEPRNREIVNRMEKLIEQNLSVCIWPKNIRGKDINDMVLLGKTSDEIRDIILKNRTRDSLTGSLDLMQWRNV